MAGLGDVAGSVVLVRLVALQQPDQTTICLKTPCEEYEAYGAGPPGDERDLPGANASELGWTWIPRPKP